MTDYYNVRNGLNGLSEVPTPKQSSIIEATPSGKFVIFIHSRPQGAAAPNSISVSIYDYGECLLLQDNNQSYIYEETDGDDVVLKFVWDNTDGQFRIGTLFVDVVIDDVLNKYQVRIPDTTYGALKNTDLPELP